MVNGWTDEKFAIGDVMESMSMYAWLYFDMSIIPES